jgi:hypothetical protein
MKRPSWVNVVGIMAIVMGCCGVLGAVQTFGTPKMMAMQKEMIPRLKQQMAQGDPAQSKYFSEEMSKMYDKMSQVPAWFDRWCLISGALALLISIGFILSGIALLQLKKAGIAAFYWVAGVDICFLVVRAVVGFSASAWIGMPAAMTGALAAVVTVALWVTAANGSKEVFLK